jgi:2Fe-2S ferredoxin
MAVLHVTNRAGETFAVEGKPGNTVMEILRDADVDVEAICGGCCSCATCHVFVDDAWIEKTGSRSEDEQELVEQTDSFKPDNSRLSCQIRFTDALDGLAVTVAPPD